MTKEALDHKGSETEYPVYSMSVLWSMTALKPEHCESFADTPLDGDAMARSRYQELKLADAWTRLDAAAASRIRNNHDEIDRNNR